MERFATIELSKEYQKFSAAHFTIFSATERERLHGHNYRVSVAIEAPVQDDGLVISYRVFKDKLKQLCEELDEYVHLPALSPYLHIERTGDCYKVGYNGESMLLLCSDTLVLPIRNTTLEEYSYYILERLMADELINAHHVRQIEVKVASGPGQWGSSRWQRHHA